MVSRGDIPHNGRLSESIVLTVLEVNTDPTPPREIELTATDEDGREIDVIIWKTHQIDQDWTKGRDYEIRRARGKRYSTCDGTQVELHSTSAFKVRERRQQPTTRLLVMGDTHVGFRHRSLGNKPTRAKNVDGREAFACSLARAREQNVDAVLHAGDVFDHHNTRSDRKKVESEIERTVAAGIPFYYIFGNHDDKKGQKLLTSTSGDHLAEKTPLIGQSPVNVFGVNHSGHEFPKDAPDASIEMVQHRNIAVIHEKPYPVVDDNKKLVYKQNNDVANVLEFIEAAHYGIDLVITGHQHVAKRARIQEYDIPVIVTGPTIPISKYKKDKPSTWQINLGPDDIEISRQHL
jgi:predicted phosphodiesterase